MENMTKAQRKQLKREQKLERREHARLEAERRKSRAKWAKGTVVLLILVVAGYFLFFNKPDMSQAGVLRLSTTLADLGDVSLQGGVVQVEIPIVNIGEGDLTIERLDSSCGCTTASIVDRGVEGPRFSMAAHGTNPSNWDAVVPPGESAVLKIYYDPAVHPSLRGSVTRVITVYSDDPVNPQQQVRVRVNQVD